MGDVFKEQLVAKKRTIKDYILVILIMLVAIVLLLFVIPMLGTFSLLAVALILFGTYWLIQRFDIEYEYILTNDELDVDKIIGKSKRKKLLTVSVKEFEIMAHVNDEKYAHELSNYNKILDYSSGEIKLNTYAAIFNYNNQKVKMIFEPNEEIIKGIFQYIPRKLHIKK
ncbi:MAG TPA: DUF6106 family protein [Defluviitaleaceae bacterium]|nr:ABC transporter ATP-binding protein [Candidatus Epulonipiscium sp.]HOQ16793.1 DUF6106 family protein [Defluviitaleaceae bacterium]HQD49865.1 DUF6106 family protein [Defluviitaleaceae bacterium]